MKTLDKTLFTTTFGLAALSSVVAHASGFYISGDLSSTSLEHTIERSLDANAPSLPAPDAGGVSSVKETDFSTGVSVGYRRNISDKAFLGIEGFYSAHNAESKNINGVLITEIDLDSSYGARVLAGLNVNDDFSVYLHGGLTEIDYDIQNSYSFAPPMRTLSDTESGFTYGVGADYKLSDHYSVYSQFSQTTDVDFDGLPEVAGGTGRINPNELDLTQVSIGLKYKF